MKRSSTNVHSNRVDGIQWDLYAKDFNHLHWFWVRKHEYFRKLALQGSIEILEMKDTRESYKWSTLYMERTIIGNCIQKIKRNKQIKYMYGLLAWVFINNLENIYIYTHKNHKDSKRNRYKWITSPPHLKWVLSVAFLNFI